MIRLAHVSDVHVYCPHAKWALRDWFSKRLSGWLNIKMLWRSRLFLRAAEILAALVDDIYERQPDVIVFSGDATALGFEEEFALAASLFRVGKPGAIPGFAVPGNHDYYTRHGAALGLFEKHFGPWLEGERVDGAKYPFARRIGPLRLIGVNSCKGNVWAWDATGRVGEEQRQRLAQLLASPYVAERTPILVTHYPIARPSGRPENRFHGLQDLPQTLTVAEKGKAALWLHGHIHHPYYLSGSPVPSLCCGSGTEVGCWTYAEYGIDGENVDVERRKYDAQTGRFQPGDSCQLRLETRL